MAPSPPSRPSRLRNHDVAPRQQTEAVTPGRLDRRLAGGRRAADFKGMPCRDPAGAVFDISAASMACGPGGSAPSATPPAASPRTTCASCDFSASGHATAGRARRDARSAIRAGVPGLARLSAERVWSGLETHPGRPGPARVAGADAPNRGAGRRAGGSRDPGRLAPCSAPGRRPIRCSGSPPCWTATRRHWRPGCGFTPPPSGTGWSPCAAATCRRIGG